MEQKSFEMSSEQIDEMAHELCDHNHKGICTFDGNRCDLICTRGDIIKQIYNAGYRKQKHGEWIAKDNFDGRCTIASCSSCGTEKAFAVLVRIETISTLYPYCQKCGSQMKGGDRDGT